MTQSPVFHGLSFGHPQPAETKVLLMKTLGTIAAWAVLLVSLSALSLRGQDNRGAKFDGDPRPLCPPNGCPLVPAHG